MEMTLKALPIEVATRGDDPNPESDVWLNSLLEGLNCTKTHTNMKQFFGVLESNTHKPFSIVVPKFLICSPQYTDLDFCSEFGFARNLIFSGNHRLYELDGKYKRHLQSDIEIFLRKFRVLGWLKLLAFGVILSGCIYLASTIFSDIFLMKTIQTAVLSICFILVLFVPVFAAMIVVFESFVVKVVNSAKIVLPDKLRRIVNAFWEAPCNHEHLKELLLIAPASWSVEVNGKALETIKATDIDHNNRYDLVVQLQDGRCFVIDALDNPSPAKKFD
jgi:hypothetical protein